MVIHVGVSLLGIDDPQIWLAYLASIFSALGCMIYGTLHWTGEDKKKVAKCNAQKSVNQKQSEHM